MAPCNEIHIEDLNNDGKLDALLLGNSYSPEVETGRYDAGNGTVLMGDGKGNFKFESNLKTGFWATKEARDIQIVNLANGKKLYLTANNNDVLETYIK